MISTFEYIWLDGNKPTQQLRSKTRFLDMPADRAVRLEDLPEWSFDGSSTYQSQGGDSDLLLDPVRIVSDPTRSNGYLVMCEVMNSDDSPHLSNQRSRLRQVLEAGAESQDSWFGFEQEYTLFENGRPLGWPKDGGYPAPQGPFYCGVGAREVFGRELVEEHSKACIDAGLMIYGINAEVMPGQWEFQIGYRGVASESADPLTVCDHLWIGRWLLHRLGESRGISVSFENKPVSGDWNGAGNHTNFSTAAMRTAGKGMAAIEDAIERLSKAHMRHIEHYGAGLGDRLTGQHETCSIDEFRSGVADRGASIRIPRSVANEGHGYLEDRRPGANSDPYVVASHLLATMCGLESALEQTAMAV